MNSCTHSHQSNLSCMCSCWFPWILLISSPFSELLVPKAQSNVVRIYWLLFYYFPQLQSLESERCQWRHVHVSSLVATSKKWRKLEKVLSVFLVVRLWLCCAWVGTRKPTFFKLSGHREGFRCFLSYHQQGYNQILKLNFGVNFNVFFIIVYFLKLIFKSLIEKFHAQIILRLIRVMAYNHM